MGLTPLEGLPGATRSGSLDPSLIFHYASNADTLSSSSTAEMHITTAEEILNKKSGWKALTGTTDFGLVTKKAAQGDEMAQLAIDIFVDRVVGYIGSYWVKLGGKLDALVFAGGIGENGKEFRQAVYEQVSCLGLEMDKTKNDKASESDDKVIDISAGERPRTLVVKTDEQVLKYLGYALIEDRDGARVYANERDMDSAKGIISSSKKASTQFILISHQKT